jgi:hypothetical protein
MPEELLPLHPFNHITQTVTACIEVRTVDLVRVSGKNDLRILSALLMIVLTSWGVRFWASSTIMYCLGMDLP